MSITRQDITNVRIASYLLPNPGGVVVRDLLFEIETLLDKTENLQQKNIELHDTLCGVKRELRAQVMDKNKDGSPYPCKSGKHFWFEKKDADKCCNGFKRILNVSEWVNVEELRKDETKV